MHFPEEEELITISQWGSCGGLDRQSEICIVNSYGYSRPFLDMYSLFIIPVWFRKTKRKFVSFYIDLLIWLLLEK